MGLEKKKDNININLGMWKSVFAVPCEIIDQHLGSSSLEQIKVLLWILRNSDNQEKLNNYSYYFDSKVFCQCFKYWQDLGVFGDKNKNIINHEEPKLNNKISKYKKPDSAHVVQRIKNSDEIYSLIQEAQNVLGRLLSSGDNAVLIMLHDNEGLPVDVILMLLQYAVSINKSNIRYIEKTGINWALTGIDTVAKAEQKIQNLNRLNMFWRKFESLIGIEHRSPTSSEEEIILKWYDKWHYNEDLIKHAYEICVNTKGKYIIKYMDGIIKKWHSQNISNLEQLKSQDLNNNLSKNKQKTASDLSYNIDEYENYSIFDK